MLLFCVYRDRVLHSFVFHVALHSSDDVGYGNKFPLAPIFNFCISSTANRGEERPAGFSLNSHVLIDVETARRSSSKSADTPPKHHFLTLENADFVFSIFYEFSFRVVCVCLQETETCAHIHFRKLFWSHAFQKTLLWKFMDYCCQKVRIFGFGSSRRGRRARVCYKNLKATMTFLELSFNG